MDFIILSYTKCLSPVADIANYSTHINFLHTKNIVCDISFVTMLILLFLIYLTIIRTVTLPAEYFDKSYPRHPKWAWR